MLGMCWNATNCQGKKKLLGPVQAGMDPSGCPLAPSSSGVHDQSHPTSDSQSHLGCPLPTHCSCLCPSPLGGALCPPGVPLHPTHLSPINSNSPFKHYLDTTSAGNPLLTPPTPRPPDPCVYLYHCNSTITAITCVCLCLPSLLNCKHLRVE